MTGRPADYVVVGLGLTGRSCVRFLRDRGATVVAMDTRAEPPCADDVRRECPEARVLTGGLDADELAACGRIILSPGVPTSDPFLRAAVAGGVDLVGDIELFAETAQAPVVAITGTNGKSTVTVLVTEMLQAAGIVTRTGGNLGPPALDLIQDHEPDAYVLELSSFQLELTRTLAPRVACILNISPDHLDRHGSYDRYLRAKARILDGAETAVMNADDPATAALTCSGKRVDFTLRQPRDGMFGLRETASGTVLAGPAGAYLAVDDLKLAGRHNAGNALAAIAICSEFGPVGPEMVRALTSFRGLEHRAEVVAEIEGVTFINDSKATNPGASCASIEGLCSGRSGVLIAGGDPKGADFSELADAAARHMHTVVLIGAASEQIDRALNGRIASLYATDLHAAVSAAARLARPGEVVLLSPGCASFDMFDDYEHRGRVFRQAVDTRRIR
jgi:UDP-N-acetylmuramoylalanine--D-glutamate ligase